MAGPAALSLNYGTEPGSSSNWLYREEEAHRSREAVTILATGSNRTVYNGQVLGRITVGAATAAAVAGNTGNGTFGAVTVGAGAKPGVYRCTCIEPAANAGRFLLTDPEGVEIGAPTVAVAFSGGGLSFTIADGATDFAAGDAFTITVAAGSGLYTELDAAGTDGRQIPAAIMFQDTLVKANTNTLATCIVREAIVVGTQLGWPAGYTNNQIAAALAVLASAPNLIISRASSA